MKVMTVLGTRPEIIRLSCVIRRLDASVEHVLVNTGQNYDYELNELFFKVLRIRKPDYFLGITSTSPAAMIGRVIVETDRLCADLRPDALLVLGDTNSSLAAIAAKRNKIPVFHMEAGNRCFDFRVPEEINRRIVDHVADINLTYSQIAREYLLREGLPPDHVICTGSPMREVLEYYKDDIERSDALERLGLTRHKYFLVSVHREENVDPPQALAKVIDILNGLAERFDLPIVVSTHPRTRKRMEAARIPTHPHVHFHKPFGFIDFVCLQLSARTVLSDSGTITEESSILNFPALNLREVHERPEGFEEGAVMLVGLSLTRVLDALAILESQPRGADRILRIVDDYSSTNVSEKVLRIILSYTDFVRRRTWGNV